MFYLPVRVGAAVAVLVSSTVVGVSSQSAQSIAPVAGAEPLVRITGAGTVSIHADGASVRALLEGLQPACAMAVRMDAVAAARRVSVDVAEVTPMGAVVEVLRASGLDFAMQARCGTAARPSLVVLQDTGGGPPEIALQMLAAQPQVDASAAVAPEAPPADPATRPDDDRPRMGGMVTIGAGTMGDTGRAPGQLTGAELVERLSPTRRSDAAIIELPFTDRNGQPYRQARPPSATTRMMRPFPDAKGSPVFVAIPSGAKARSAGFPVVRFDSPGAAKDEAGAAAPVPVSPQRPGGGAQR